MASILVLYGTGEGQTAKVADRIEASLVERAHECTTVDVESIPNDIDVEAFDAVLVGSSIHIGKHHSAVREFVTQYSETLNAQPTGFFQVSLSSAVDKPEPQAEAAQYVDRLLEESGWHPDKIGLFGGALRYSKYGFLKRLMLKQIAKSATGDVDTSRDYEYTDWDEVDAFTADFAGFVENRLAEGAMTSDDA